MDYMDFPDLHRPFIQPVNKKTPRLPSAFERMRDQIPLDREILPISYFFANLYMHAR